MKDFPGPLSIKSVSSGSVIWKTGGRELTVGRDSFLVLNHGEPYSMEIESHTPVSTLCVFFQAGFVESAAQSLARSGIEPEADPDPAPSRFRLRLHSRDCRILPRMQNLANACLADQLWIDEQFLNLACDLLQLNREMARRVGLMPARRPATREELFRRVLRGQEFLHANACGHLDLASLAQQACLSPFHFHRAFTKAFGKTPNQYRNELRLAEARRLLEASNMTVTEICGAVGFESAASFSSLFRRSFGAPPSSVGKSSKIR